MMAIARNNGILLVCLLVAVTAPFAAGQSADSLYADAVRAYERGDLQRAILLYEELVKRQPDSVAVRTDLGVALAQVGRYADAVTQYGEALKREPQNPVVQLNLALAWYKQAEFPRAATELESLRRAHSDNQQSLYLLADCYLRLGRNADAVALLRPAYEANPEDRAVVYALGTALIRDGQIQQGEAVIDRILKDGNNAEAKLLMGEAQFASRDYKTASATLRTALDLNPNLPGAWSLYGRALLNREDTPGAKTAFERALQADANDFAANLYLGAVLRLEADNARAGPYLERALRLRPASPQARFQIAALNAATGKLGEARKEFEQLARQWPDFLEVHVQLASIYARLNLKEESLRERKIVLELNEKAREKGPVPEP